MARKIENGRVYRLKTQLDLKPLLKKEERYYKRLKPLHAMYFVAVYKATSKRTYFAPLCRKKCKKSIEVEVAGEKYYAKFNEVQHLLDTWVEESDIVDLVSKEELDQILEKYRKWKQAYDEKKRKKAIAKQFEKEEEISQIGDCMIYNKPTYGDNFANVPASVSWSISHPF